MRIIVRYSAAPKSGAGSFFQTVILMAACGMLLLTGLLVASGWSEDGESLDWKVAQGNKGTTHYSPLKQIDRSNVAELEIAWIYRTGDKREDPPSTIECNPIVIDGVMYVTSPMLKVVALDASTGREIWACDPTGRIEESPFVNRGVTYWQDGSDRRILFVAGSRLFALDAATGRPVAGFGENGAVDLRQGLDRDIGKLFYTVSSPGIIYRDLLILGSAVGEGPGPSAPGHIRAFDVRTGRQEWIFHTIPHPGEEGYETWPPDAWKTSGGANAWGGISLDEERGLVFLPTGSPSYDFYGGDRAGKNLFSTSVVALKAGTGELVWHFQTIRHNLWDYDLPASPTLVTVRHDNQVIDAVAQVTKTGHLFLLDRETGHPLFPIEERSVPTDGVEGESVWPTQPLPVKPLPFARVGFTEQDITDISAEAAEYVRQRFRELRSGDLYTPPSIQGSVLLPGYNGGAEWGAASFDPETGILYVNSQDVTYILALVEPRAVSGGESLYQLHCAACHGLDRKGQPPTFPTLIGIEEKLGREKITEIINSGLGQMPAFQHLSAEETETLVSFLTGSHRLAPWIARQKKNRNQPEGAASELPPYIHTGYGRFRDPEGYSGVKPPWGRFTAIDLNTGEHVWQVPLGEHPELSARGIPLTGTENIGGSIVTAGGLVFIGATRDERFRAFDKATGEILWEAQLEAGGYATPATYMVKGRQYVVIAAGGGGKVGTRAGDAYVAFALPN